MKTLNEITERLQLILNEEYSTMQFNIWIGFNCDFEIDSLENNTSTIEEISSLIYNAQ